MSSKKRVIGLQIISARHLLNLTQDELAKKARVSAGKIKNMEKHKYKESGYTEYSSKIEDCLLNMGISFYEDKEKIGITISKKELNKIKTKAEK